MVDQWEVACRLSLQKKQSGAVRHRTYKDMLATRGERLTIKVIAFDGTQQHRSTPARLFCVRGRPRADFPIYRRPSAQEWSPSTRYGKGRAAAGTRPTVAVTSSRKPNA